MAERLAVKQGQAKWANIVISALITGGAVGALFEEGGALGSDVAFAGYATAALAIFSLIFNAYLKDLDPGALAQRHRESASNMWNLRESYLSLITDAVDDALPLETIRERRDDLQSKLHELYLAAPFTDSKAYGKAQQGLKDNEELMFTEKEIDDMLPHTLRRENRRANQ